MLFAQLFFEFLELFVVVLTDQAVVFVNVSDNAIVDAVVGSAVLFVYQVDAINQLLDEARSVLHVDYLLVLTVAIKEESQQFAFWSVVFGFEDQHHGTGSLGDEEALVILANQYCSVVELKLLHVKIIEPFQYVFIWFFNC